MTSLPRQTCAAFAALVIAAAWHVTATGQGPVTITFPDVIAAGPDYATDVLRDPWDMSNVEDVSLDPGEVGGFANFSVNSGGNGLAGGTTAITDAGVMFLSRGIYGTVNALKSGFTFPIDTASYQKVSVRLSDSGPGENPQVYWFPKQSGEASPEEFGVRFLPPTKPGFSILVTSLGPPDTQTTPWTSAPMRGFRIDPNSDNAGNDMFFDWIRLTCADNSPCATMNTASWTGGSGDALVEVLDAGGTVLNVAPTPTVSGTSLSWNTGILPPGNYTLRVTRGSDVGTKAFRVNTPPTIAVTDPSRTSGADYATAVLGNAWDMSTANDIAGSTNVDPITFSAGQLHGTNTNGDPAIALLDHTNNSQPIDTSRYRYFTYRMQVDGPVDIANGSVSRIFWGSGPSAGGAEITTTRDIVAFAGMRDYTLDLASLSVGVTGGLEESGAQEIWTTNNKRQLRFDPHEFAAARPFHIDDVKLTANPESYGTYTLHWAGADADAGDAATVNLYYDDDRNLGNGKTTIVTLLPIAQGSYVWDATGLPLGTYNIYAEAFDGVNVTGVYADAPIFRTTAPCVFTLAPTSAPAPYAGGAGTADVTASAPTCSWTATSNASFVTVTGGAAGTGNGTVSYSVARNPAHPARTGTLTIGGQVFTINQAGSATAGDFTGDGHADYTAYNPANGLWTSTGQSAVQFGLPGDIPVPGDYNGDVIVDRAVFRPSDGGWYIQGVGFIQWGVVGDLPVPADYDGDGITDLAVFRRVNGGGAVWYIRNQAPLFFGLPGDEPVPADYDGDGKADLAVYRPTTGTWYVALSSTGFATVSTIQWGLPGDVPVPGDFDGDHRADITVFRPSTGIWYLLYSASNYSTSFALHWGVLGDVPVAADFSGDGFDDPTVFRASDATFWTYNPVSMLGSSQQQGSPGDLAVVQRPRRPVVATADFDGDLRADVTVFRPSDGNWFTRHSYSDYVTTQVIQWGLSGDTAVPGDYDGDHITDVAVWRPSNGTWYLKYSIGGYTATAAFQWGLQNDVPVPADYDGDGRTDLAVFRPSTGDWFVLRSSSNYTTVFNVQWGLSGDVPVPADYDGDGKADVAIFRPVSGEWFLNRLTLGPYVRQFGLSSDVPITGDFDRDGRADLTIFRPSTGQWLGIDPATSNPTMNRQWGLNGDTPLAHDFDGDGAADTTVFRPASAEWFIVFSSAPNGPTKYLQWGLGNSDQPLR